MPLSQRDPAQAMTTNTANVVDHGGGSFKFIVGGTHAEMRSKKNMTIVRKKAMQDYLERSKEERKKPRPSPDWAQHNSDLSNYAVSNLGRQSLHSEIPEPDQDMSGPHGRRVP